MGYTTQFEGSIEIDPPLSREEADYLVQFSNTRHMQRDRGPYYVDGQYGDGDNSDVPDYNRPGDGQPGLWCKWVPNQEGNAIEWNGMENFYDAPQWMEYLIEHFLKPGHHADMPFLQSHTLNGEILAQGEDIRDRWKLIVENNKVSTLDLE